MRQIVAFLSILKWMGGTVWPWQWQVSLYMGTECSLTLAHSAELLNTGQLGGGSCCCAEVPTSGRWQNFMCKGLLVSHLDPLR